MNPNNYILARWRDAITDPPPAVWGGVCRIIAPDGRILHMWFHSDRQYGPDPSDRGRVQWLDITSIPGVPREAVQAAVDRLVDAACLLDCDCPTCDAIRAMSRELGIVPSGVKDPLTTQEAPHA